MLLSLAKRTDFQTREPRTWHAIRNASHLTFISASANKLRNPQPLNVCTSNIIQHLCKNLNPMVAGCCFALFCYDPLKVIGNRPIFINFVPFFIKSGIFGVSLPFWLLFGLFDHFWHLLGKATRFLIFCFKCPRLHNITHYKDRKKPQLKHILNMKQGKKQQSIRQL
jgi:hypothetical protein